MILAYWRKVLIVWAPFWANMPWTTHDWNPCSIRNILHIFMHTLHGIHMLLMFTHMTPCMLVCTLYTLWTYVPPCKISLDRIYDSNFANKFVWVRKCANPIGPKKAWVPKSTPMVFHVGVGSRLTWGFRCLDGGCVWARWTLHWMHHLQGCLVGGPPRFVDLEIYPIGFGNYL